MPAIPRPERSTASAFKNKRESGHHRPQGMLPEMLTLACGAALWQIGLCKARAIKVQTK